MAKKTHGEHGIVQLLDLISIVHDNCIFSHLRSHRICSALWDTYQLSIQLRANVVNTLSKR